MWEGGLVTSRVMTALLSFCDLALWVRHSLKSTGREGEWRAQLTWVSKAPQAAETPLGVGVQGGFQAVPCLLPG